MREVIATLGLSALSAVVLGGSLILAGLAWWLYGALFGLDVPGWLGF